METRPRIIIIDDNANDVQVTRRFLERRGYDTVPALSGEEGLRAARQIAPDAFVVDYRMPGMDGFEVTRQVKADPALQTIPVLMLTGSDSAQDVVTGLGVGADDFVTKGSDVEIVAARLRALLRVKAYQDQLRRMNQQMTRDLQIARRVQEALVPQNGLDTDRIEIRSAYIPSATLSGDFYDYFSQDGMTWIFVADVSGHGLPAAILVSLLKSYVHTRTPGAGSLASFMEGLNNFLYSVSLPAQYATAALFRIDDARRLVFANAAHPPFLFCRSAERRTEVVEQPSNLVGAMHGMTFEEQALTVERGDTLFVFTDGLTDRVNGMGEFYSIDRIARLLEARQGEPIDTLYESIREDVAAFTATEEFRDDIAFVVARFH